jgi:hypothetical protein
MAESLRSGKAGPMGHDRATLETRRRMLPGAGPRIFFQRPRTGLAYPMSQSVALTKLEDRIIAAPWRRGQAEVLVNQELCLTRPAPRTHSPTLGHRLISLKVTLPSTISNGPVMM